MISLSDFLKVEAVRLDVEATDKTELLNEMAGWLADAGLIDESGRRTLAERLIQREQMGSTCVGRRLALPHSHLESLSDPVIGFARLVRPIDFGPPEGLEVDLVFLLVVPSGDTLLELRAISKLCRVLKDDRFVADLRAAASPEDVKKAFEEVEARHLG